MANLDMLDLDTVRIDAGLALRVPEALAVRRRVMAFGEDDSGVQVACQDPSDLTAIEAVERAVGRTVVPVRVDPGSLDRALRRVFAERSAGHGEDAVHLVEELLHAALLDRASDVHIEPDQDGVRVRFRVDGVLESHRRLSHEQVASLVNRLKVLAGIDIAEKRLPQDGRFTHRVGRGPDARTIDVRCAAMPTRFGERLTLRLLAAQAERLTLTSLGLSDRDLVSVTSALNASQGLVLLTGPTGSGKSTTLYAALRSIDLAARNVLTVEDPVEYDLPGASQIEVDSADRISFGVALRSLLRHDPDVLMIGEIRDLETASVAIRAALTGHLVLSTLHTSSAIGAVTRLIDIGVPAYLVAATLRLTVAQRLVRKLCPRCRSVRAPNDHERHALELGHEGEVSDPTGCAVCRRSGYAGRIGLFEVREVGADARCLIAAGASEDELLSHGFGEDARTLRLDAKHKVLAGITSPSEALRSVDVI